MFLLPQEREGGKSFLIPAQEEQLFGRKREKRKVQDFRFEPSSTVVWEIFV